MDLSAFATKTEVEDLRLDQISPDPSQPRKEFASELLNELAESIKQHGLIQPILVREKESGDGYIIIAGERRYRACQQLGLETIKAIVHPSDAGDADDAAIGYLQMSENIKRADLKFYEIADFIASRIAVGEKQVTIAKKLGLPKAYISQYKAWSDAPEWLKAYKERFGGVHVAYLFIKQAEGAPEALQAFLAEANDEVFTKGTLEKFKHLNFSDDAATTTTSTTSTDTTSGEDASNSDAAADAISDNAKSASPDAESGDTDDTADAHQEDSTNGGGSDKSGTSDDLDTAAAENVEAAVADIEANTENEDAAVTVTETEASVESAADVLLDEAEEGEQLFTKPRILATVAERKCELLFKRKPETEGFVLVRYEDGSEESVLAESVQLNRIIES